jgi:thiamine kinase-like enzyme
MGENNLSILAKVNDKIKLVFRIGLRKDLEKRMKYEFRMLRLLPHDIGPEPIYFDDSKKIINHAYMILSYVEGKATNRWGKKQLSLHAKKLALLHKKKYDFRGTPEEKHKKIDLMQKFREQAQGYGGMFSDKDIKPLLQNVSKFVKENNHYFTSQKKFSLIHGDGCKDNILFSKNDVHYIDWEFIQMGDPAEDLTRFFYQDIQVDPWFIKLNRKKLEYLLNEYLKYHKDKTLKERVIVWNAVLKFLDFLYFRWKVKHWRKERSQLPKKHYEKAAKKMHKSLMKQFVYK